MTIANHLFIAAFLILVAVSAAVTGSMLMLGLVDRLFRKKPPEPVAPDPEPEVLDEEWEEFWSKDQAKTERLEGPHQYSTLTR
jgi:hypothetical protein